VCCSSEIKIDQMTRCCLHFEVEVSGELHMGSLEEIRLEQALEPNSIDFPMEQTGKKETMMMDELLTMISEEKVVLWGFLLQYKVVLAALFTIVLGENSRVRREEFIYRTHRRTSHLQ